MAGLTYSQVNILQLWFMTLFYGVYAVIFSASMYTILSKSRRPIGKRLLSITVVLFIFSTVQTICLLVLTILTLSYDQAFGVNTSTLPPATIRMLERDQNVINLYQSITDSMIAMTNFIADALLVWRCFVVWGRQFYVIALPTIILIAGTACGYGVAVVDVIWYLRKFHHPMLKDVGPGWATLIHLETVFTKGFLIMSAVTNLLMSIMIAGRIFWAIKSQSGYASQPKKYKRLVYLIIESGAVYSIALLLSGVLYTSGYSIPQGVFEALQYQLVGIFPTLIVLLVSLGKTVEQTQGTVLSSGLMEFAASPGPDVEKDSSSTVPGLCRD